MSTFGMKALRLQFLLSPHLSRDLRFRIVVCMILVWSCKILLEMSWVVLFMFGFTAPQCVFKRHAVSCYVLLFASIVLLCAFL
jgi:hypothetical protein